MQATRRYGAAAAPLAAALTAALAAGVAPAARAELIYGLNANNQLYTFDSATPGTFSSLTGTANALTTVTGLSAGDVLQDIDIRPTFSDGLNDTLYGLALNTTATPVLRLYTISKTTGAVLSTITLADSPADPRPFAPSAANYGIDFNPQANALRIVNDAGQNFRIPGVNLSPGGATLGLTLTDLDLNGGTGIGSIAYDRNFAGTTGTTLFDVSHTSDQLFDQNLPNDGTLNLRGALTVAGAPINIGPEYGFDVSGLTGVAYLAVNPVGSNSWAFHTLNLANGQASAPVAFSAGVGTVRGIAAPIGVAAPEPGTLVLLGAGLLRGAAFTRRRRAAGAK